MVRKFDMPFNPINQLNDLCIDFVNKLYNGEIKTFLDFFKIYAHTEQKEDKLILHNDIAVKTKLDIFAETIYFLEEEKCIVLQETNIEEIPIYFSIGNTELRLFNKFRELPNKSFKINKRNIRKLKKRKYMSEEYDLKINENKYLNKKSNRYVIATIIFTIILTLITIFIK